MEKEKMTRVAIVTDTHFGARKNSKLFHNYFERFYNEVFFPKLDEEGIKTVIHMGDCFDSRKGVDFAALTWAKRVFFEPLKERGIQLHLLAGNHDCYYKNTNSVTSVNLLTKEFDNVRVYSETEEAKFGELNILFIPWINVENLEASTKLIQKSTAKVAMGHLELNGFRAHRGHVMEDGMDADIFGNFDIVFSGHYHTRSDNGKVYYLGNPYEMFWNDVNDKRGFYLFDTETLEREEIRNPFRLFYNVYYEDTPPQMLDTRNLCDKIVKVIVRKKTDIQQFEKFIDKIYSANVHELKIVENFQLIESDEFEAEESEDTMSILARYIEESETELDKSNIQRIIQEVYQEACEVI